MPEVVSHTTVRRIEVTDKHTREPPPDRESVDTETAVALEKKFGATD
ncbi:MAG: hypothetical protein JSW10_00325 [Pseudomonadota bacterium]|nr:MAG: hypothetical protein JSW10_00325 [Pseudomonadota bacterium]